MALFMYHFVPLSEVSEGILCLYACVSSLCLILVGLGFHLLGGSSEKGGTMRYTELSKCLWKLKKKQILNTTSIKTKPFPLKCITGKRELW